MIDTPPPRERFLDSRYFALSGGIVAAMVTISVASLLRINVALDRAAWDRIATALADMPAAPELLVVRAASRTGDWKIADAVVRLDSANVRAVGIAVDLSVPVAPTGTLPELLTVSPNVVVGVTLAGDSVAWPWFVADSARQRNRDESRIGFTALLRDPDGVIRLAPVAGVGEIWLADRMAALLAGRTRESAASIIAPRATPVASRLRFAYRDSVWSGIRSLSIDSVLAMDLTSLTARVSGNTVLLGIDDGSSVPTSVGAMPMLAVLAHDVNDRAAVVRGAWPAIRDASTGLVVLWLSVWVLLAALGAAWTSVRLTPVFALAGILAQVAAALWAADSLGRWLPLGTTILLWVATIAGAEIVSFWQTRRRQHLTTLLFSQFVTPALASQAWGARHLYLEGGRPAPLQLHVTVLFVDLRGFTRFSEAHSATDVMQLLTQVTAACAADITAHGGLVDDFAGDGIKADFGVPVPRTHPTEIATDARNAVRCALQLAATIERLLPPTMGTAGTQARFGIHSGLGVAGTIGGASRRKYTVVGDVVNVAARLQAIDLAHDAVLTSRCRIVLSADTMSLLDSRAPAVDDLGIVALAGRTQPVHAFRIRRENTPTTLE